MMKDHRLEFRKEEFDEDRSKKLTPSTFLEASRSQAKRKKIPFFFSKPSSTSNASIEK